MAESKEPLVFDKTKEYSSNKNALWLLDTVYILFLFFVFLNSGLSKALAQKLATLMPNSLFVLPAYLFIALLAYYLLDLPLNYYRSFALEHKFCVSDQKIGDWFFDQFKAGTLSYLLGLILISVFYYILKHHPNSWWAVISLFWIFFSLVLAKLVPVVIIPLFFKYKKLEDKYLKGRIMSLADKMKVKILDCFEIDFSRKSLKANAAFVGWGATKRVILADTLKEKYSFDEIEVILAHEFAHYKLKHLLKLLFINSLVVLLCFYLIFKTSGVALGFFGLSSLQDLASLPVIFIYFILFGILMQPCENYVSRRLERNADCLALKVTGLADAFISMMEKLGAQNLADRNPNPLIKFFFFDHPSIAERVAMAHNLK
jgi:STE24 endopeptidase